MKKLALLVCVFALLLAAGPMLMAQSMGSGAQGGQSLGNGAPSGQMQGGQSMSEAEAIHERVQSQLQMLGQRINLTDTQKTQLGPVLEEEIQKLQAVHEDSSLSPTDQQSKMQEIRQSYRPRIDAILTPEQQQKLSDMSSQRRPQ